MKKHDIGLFAKHKDLVFALKYFDKEQTDSAKAILNLSFAVSKQCMGKNSSLGSLESKKLLELPESITPQKLQVGSLSEIRNKNEITTQTTKFNNITPNSLHKKENQEIDFSFFDKEFENE